MNRLMIAIATIVALLAVQPGSRAQETPARRYELPNLDSLELVVPPAWDDTVDQPADGGPPTIQLHPREGAPFEIFITPDWPDAPDATVPDAEALRETVRGAAERMRDQAVEETIEIRRLQGESGVGFYFVATDREPKPEEFKYMNQGALQVGDLTVIFTILTNDGQDAVIEEAFAMLKGAVHRGTGLDQR